MTIAQKDTESFINAVRSMTEKFILLFESNAVSQGFSWFTFRDETLLSAIQHSFGVLTDDEREHYDRLFNQVMQDHGYVFKSVDFLDDKVEIWHTTPSLSAPLHEYLGIAWGDYKHFLFGREIYFKQ